MGARYDNIAGIQHKVSKRYDNINGVFRPVSKRYDNIAGVWQQGYSGAVEWTYTESHSAEASAYGNGPTYTCIMGLNRYNSGTSEGGCTVTYTFKEPLVLPAGSTLSGYSINNLEGGRPRHTIYFNGNLSAPVYQTILPTNATEATYVYTIPSSIALSTVATQIDMRISGAINRINEMHLTINQLGGLSFLLNNSGISN